MNQEKFQKQYNSGLARPQRPGLCLDSGFQYALIQNNRSKEFGVEYWVLPGSNTLWHSCNSQQLNDVKKIIEIFLYHCGLLRMYQLKTAKGIIIQRLPNIKKSLGYPKNSFSTTAKYIWSLCVLVIVGNLFQILGHGGEK